MVTRILGDLEKEIQERIYFHERKISGHIGKIRYLLPDDNGPIIYGEIAEISRHAELLVKDLRDLIVDFHNSLQASGFEPGKRFCHEIPDVELLVEGNCIRLIMGGILPYPLKGSVYYLHEKLDVALEHFVEEQKLPRPFFTDRCAVVFLHHYGSSEKELRHLRDYDNVEHRCITNVLAAHLLWGDSPKCMISVDVLAPGDANFTEVRIMPLSEFRVFVMSENIEYVP